MLIIINYCFNQIEQEFNDEEGRTQSPTYTEEQRELKESFNKVKLDDESDNDEETWGGLFRKRDKTTQDVVSL